MTFTMEEFTRLAAILSTCEISLMLWGNSSPHDMGVIGGESQQRDLNPRAISDLRISQRFIENSNAEFPKSVSALIAKK